MILLTGLDSIIESLYLRDGLTCTFKNCTIVVNPTSSYVANKVVIINLMNYPSNKIDELLANNNTIISRFDTGDERITIDPYELRINESIIPLGKRVDLLNEDTYDKVEHIFDDKDNKLYYPKPVKCINYHHKGNLTALGYLIYQLGYQIDEVITPRFKYLDIIKLKNGIII
jgi:hypothetical protein